MYDIKDKQIKEFLSKDKVISKEANLTFNNFINQISKENKEKDKINYKLHFTKKILSIVSILVIIFFGANTYAMFRGYDNIFFMIKEKYEDINLLEDNLFSDREIIISYQSFYITESIEMQINKLQIKGNNAKLYVFINEHEKSNITPFKYKIYNEDGQIMCNELDINVNTDTQYSQILNLENYNDNITEIILEIYSNSEKLIKTVIINLKEKTIEAKTNDVEISKISQIKLNEFLEKETLKIYSEQQIKNRRMLILRLTDITYNNSIYRVKYLYCLPKQSDLEKGDVEKNTLYQNTIEFKIDGENYKLIKINQPEEISE